MHGSRNWGGVCKNLKIGARSTENRFFFNSFFSLHLYMCMAMVRAEESAWIDPEVAELWV